MGNRNSRFSILQMLALALSFFPSGQIFIPKKDNGHPRSSKHAPRNIGPKNRKK